MINWHVTGEVEALLPVIAMLLQFSPEEVILYIMFCSPFPEISFGKGRRYKKGKINDYMSMILMLKNPLIISVIS